MTAPSDYSKDDWDTLASAGSLVGHAVLISTRDVPRRVRKRHRALERAFREAGARYPENMVIQSVIADTEERSRREDSVRRLRRAGDDYRKEVLETCRRVSDVLDRRASPAESAEFKRWLLDIGEMVASAVPTEEFLGIGEGVFSRDDLATLQEVAAALNMPDYRGPKVVGGQGVPGGR